jgi:hypothetical protein
MKRLVQGWSRDVWLGLGLIMLLIVVFAATAVQGLERTPPSFSSESSGASGTRALALWLDELDLTVSNETDSVFRVPPSADAALILEPTSPIVETEWDVLETWIDRGGTLIVAGHRSSAQEAFRRFGFDPVIIDPVGSVTRPEPFPFVPEERLPVLETRLTLDTAPVEFRTHVSLEDRPIVVSFILGDGVVVLSTDAHPFTNRGLALPGNAALTLAAIHAGTPPRTVWFDEWHHGARAETGAAGPGAWLRGTAPGQALLYGAGVLFLALVLGGRSFGRPVRDRREIMRRAPLEHITAMANLSRRAGHRAAIQASFTLQLKRHLGQRYRVNPTLQNEAFVQELARFRSDLDIEALSALLEQLARPAINEQQLLALAQDVTTWLERA